jgi:hypothetical protein
MPDMGKKPQFDYYFKFKDYPNIIINLSFLE